MCLINVKLSYGRFSDPLFEKAIKNGFISNPQGAGWAIYHTKLKKVTMEKGYMGDHYNIVDRFLNDIDKAINHSSDIIVTHHRSSTAGVVNQVNCHPFIVSENEFLIRKITQIKGNLPIMVHNGIIGKYDYGDEFSDTYHFTKNLLAIPANYKLFIDNPLEFQKEYKDILNWSKIAVLDPTVGLVVTGEWIKNETGYLFSNLAYSSNGYRDLGGVGSWLKKPDKVHEEEVKPVEEEKPIEDDKPFSTELPETYKINLDKFIESFTKTKTITPIGPRNIKKRKNKGEESTIYTLDDLYPTDYNKNLLIYKLESSFRSGKIDSKWFVKTINNTSVNLETCEKNIYDFTMQNISYEDLYKHFTVSIADQQNIAFFEDVLKLLNTNISNKVFKRIVYYINTVKHKRLDVINIPNIGNFDYAVVKEFHEQHCCIMADLYKRDKNNKVKELLESNSSSALTITENTSPEEEAEFWDNVLENWVKNAH